MTDELNRTEITKFAPLTFYERHGLVWGAADLFAVGLRGSIPRLGEFAAILRLFNKERHPVVSEIVIIWPSTGKQEIVGRVKTRFAEVLRELLGAELSPTT